MAVKWPVQRMGKPYIRVRIAASLMPSSGGWHGRGKAVLPGAESIS